MEDKSRYQFLGTEIQKDGSVVALMVDVEKVGAGRADDLKKAFNAKAHARSRGEILSMTQQHLKDRIPQLKELGLNESVKVFEHAEKCIVAKMKAAAEGSKPTAKSTGAGMGRG